MAFFTGVVTSECGRNCYLSVVLGKLGGGTLARLPFLKVSRR